MTSVRPFRFGVEMMGPFEGMSWADSARELEALGYSTLFVPDHLDEGFGPITAMATAAVATSTLQVASAVFATDFRNPAILARELASIDLLSEGRLEVGVGAGYRAADYTGSGIAMDSPGTRVDRMIEHVAVLRGLFAEGIFNFHGQHYQIADLDGSPKPYRVGGPPILVGGGGRRLLTYAAEHADIIGVTPSITRPSGDTDRRPATVDEKFQWIRDAAGSRFSDLEIHAWLAHAAVTDDAQAEAVKLTPAFASTPEDVLASPSVLIGSPTELIERLHERRERWGYSYYTLQQPAAYEFASVIAQLGN